MRLEEEPSHCRRVPSCTLVTDAVVMGVHCQPEISVVTEWPAAALQLTLRLTTKEASSEQEKMGQMKGAPEGFPRLCKGPDVVVVADGPASSCCTVTECTLSCS